MSTILDRDALREAAAGLGQHLSDAQVAQFAAYASLILQANRSLNLTRITDPEGMARLHFADSLAVVKALGPAADPVARVVDVGAGPGLPGLALKIARPDWEVTLVESVRKKADFLRDTVRELGLVDVVVVNERAETLGQGAHREVYDLAVARAVARLAALAELLLPLVRSGGRVVALKGPDAAEEVDEALPAISELGGEMADLVSYRIDDETDTRYAVVLEKTTRTPDKYPRRPGMPAKRPISE